MAAKLISRHGWPRSTLLMLCMAGSVATHVVLLMLLPGWVARHQAPPRSLTVELLTQAPPEIVPPQPLPMAPHAERVTREPVKPAVRQTTEPPVTREPILAVPQEMPQPLLPPPAVVVPEQRPATKAVPSAEMPRVATAPAPVTPPRSDASYLNNPRPAYPLAARRRGEQGTVLIRVLVTAEGLAASVRLEKTSGHASLDEAALAAVKSWRFVPARQDGQAIESPYVVPVVFRLE